MDEETRQRWSLLHHRVASGEKLSEEDQIFYDAVMQKLDAEETFQIDVEGIKRLQRETAALEAESKELRALLADYEAQLGIHIETEADQLRDIRMQLAEQRRALEANMSPRMRQLLQLGE